MEAAEFSHNIIHLQLSKWSSHAQTIYEHRYIKTFVTGLVLEVDELTTRNTAEKGLQPSLPDFCNALHRCRDYQFDGGWSAYGHQSIFQQHGKRFSLQYLLTSWLMSNISAAALVLTNFPLDILSDALAFAALGTTGRSRQRSGWARAVERLEVLDLHIEESNEDDVDQTGFNTIGHLLQCTANLKRLDISLRCVTAEEKWRIVRLPDAGLPQLQSCVLHNIMVEQSSFHALIRACARTLTQLELVNIEIKRMSSSTDTGWADGSWVEAFKVMGTSRMTKTVFRFGALYDRDYWSFGLEAMETPRSHTNLSKLVTWFRTGESFPLNDLSVLARDSSISYGEAV